MKYYIFQNFNQFCPKNSQKWKIVIFSNLTQIVSGVKVSSQIGWNLDQILLKLFWTNLQRLFWKFRSFLFYANFAPKNHKIAIFLKFHSNRIRGHRFCSNWLKFGPNTPYMIPNKVAEAFWKFWFFYLMLIFTKKSQNCQFLGEKLG